MPCSCRMRSGRQFELQRSGHSSSWPNSSVSSYASRYVGDSRMARRRASRSSVDFIARAPESPASTAHDQCSGTVTCQPSCCCKVRRMSPLRQTVLHAPRGVRRCMDEATGPVQQRLLVGITPRDHYTVDRGALLPGCLRRKCVPAQRPQSGDGQAFPCAWKPETGCAFSAWQVVPQVMSDASTSHAAGRNDDGSGTDRFSAMDSSTLRKEVRMGRFSPRACHPAKRFTCSSNGSRCLRA